MTARRVPSYQGILEVRAGAEAREMDTRKVCVALNKGQNIAPSSICRGILCGRTHQGTFEPEEWLRRPLEPLVQPHGKWRKGEDTRCNTVSEGLPYDIELTR